MAYTICLKTISRLISRIPHVPALLVLNAVLLILLAMAVFATPAPGIQTSFGGASVDIRADRAWVLFPRQCVNITWQLEGIKSLYIDGHGKVGNDDMVVCPTVDSSSLSIEITAKNGEALNYFLKIRYFPAAIFSSLILLSLMLPFIIAFYYFATMRLAESPLQDLSPLLALSVLLLVCLLLQTAMPFTTDDVLKGLVNIFTSHSWYLSGWVVAGLVFIPLAIQSLWHRWQNGFREDLIVIGSFLVFVWLLYLPFGFDFIWHREEWVFQAFLEGRESKLENEVLVRFWLLILYPLANILDANAINFHHHLHIFLAASKLVLLYGIVRKLGVAPLCSFLFTILLMVYPVNALLMSSRSILHAFSMSALLAAVYLALLMEKPSRSVLLGMLVALFFNVGSYENAFGIIFIIPILWWWLSPREIWHMFHLTVIWYLIPVAKLTYMYIIANVGWSYYGAQYMFNASEHGRTLLETISHYLGVVGNVYLQTFWVGWHEAFKSVTNNAWIVSSLVALMITAVVAIYLARNSKDARPPSRLKLGQLALAGLLFIMPSIAVLMWFEQYQNELWRLYIYVPIGGAMVTISLLLLIVAPIKNRQLCHAILLCLFLMLIFPAISRLFVQQASLVKSANAKARLLSQIVEQAPYFDATARVVIVTNMSDNAFDKNGVGEFWTNTLDSAIYMLYQEGRPRVSILCRFHDRCSRDDIRIKLDSIEQVTDFSRLVLFRLHDDLSLELLHELPTELGGAQNNTYNPERLIDTTSPIPSRALTLLGDVLTSATGARS